MEWEEESAGTTCVHTLTEASLDSQVDIDSDLCSVKMILTHPSVPLHRSGMELYRLSTRSSVSLSILELVFMCVFVLLPLDLVPYRFGRHDHEDWCSHKV